MLGLELKHRPGNEIAAGGKDMIEKAKAMAKAHPVAAGAAAGAAILGAKKITEKN